jgi:hypothetical protein
VKSRRVWVKILILFILGLFYNNKNLTGFENLSGLGQTKPYDN